MTVEVRVVGDIRPGSVLQLEGINSEDLDGEPITTVLQDVINACRAAAGHDRFVVVVEPVRLREDPGVEQVGWRSPVSGLLSPLGLVEAEDPGGLEPVFVIRAP